MRRGIAIAALVAPFVVFLGLATIYGLVIGGATEDVYTRDGTLKYYALIGSDARHVPRVGRVRELQFYSSSGDGAKPAMTRVTYSTDADPSAVMIALQRHALQVGYKPSRDGYVRGDGERLELSATRESGRTEVVFWEIHY